MATTITLDKKEILNGNVLSFETKDKENIRVAEIDINTKGEFRLWFNGCFLWMGKTFKSLQKRFDTLNEKWDLEICENAES